MITHFTPYEIQDCLFDTKRTQNFLKAIRSTVKKGDVVVDAGSGSGVLGLFAARAGAKKVYCIEASHRFIEIIQKNATLNGFSKIIETIHGDATKIKLPRQVDVIICELLSTGLFYEPEIQVINHLRTFLKPGGRIIPQNCKSWVQLVSAQRSVYGLYFDYDARYERLSNDKALSTKTLFDHPNFYIEEPLNVNKKVIVTARHSGIVNAICINSKAQLGKKIYATKSEFLFNPLTIFLKKKTAIKKGRKYEIHIQYIRSKDTLGTNIRITRGH